MTHYSNEYDQFIYRSRKPAEDLIDEMNETTFKSGGTIITGPQWLKDRMDVDEPEETRVTDPVTGGQKNQKLAQLGAVDPLSLLELAKVAGFGSQKYERLNYLKGFKWSLSYDAMMRHLLAYQSGENDDPESGLPHLAHAMWHCSALLSFLLRDLGTDDRPAR
jgi:hypothetical protein